jgi:RNA polymerase sigma-70 factor (ECF subfamily)
MATLPDFAEIVREHKGMVYSMAYHALQDRAAAEDLTQDVFLALHENLGRLESAQHIKPWLARVTSNRAIDHIRKRRYRSGPSLEQVPEPRARVEQSDLMLSRRLRQMVAALPAPARMMIILRFQEEMELAEIARTLEIPVQTVKSRLHRSVNLLREKMLRRLPAAREMKQV